MTYKTIPVIGDEECFRKTLHQVGCEMVVVSYSKNNNMSFEEAQQQAEQFIKEQHATKS